MSDLKDIDYIFETTKPKMSKTQISAIIPVPKPFLIRSNTIIPQTLDDLMSFCYYVKNNPISEFTKIFKSKKPANPKLVAIYDQLLQNPNWVIMPSEAIYPETFWGRYKEGLELQSKNVDN